MIQRVTMEQAKSLLGSFKEGFEFSLSFGQTSFAVNNGEGQLIAADYRRRDGYDPLIAVAVYDRNGEMKRRFNISF